MKTSINGTLYIVHSGTLYIALFSIIFVGIVRIGTYFVYYKYVNRNKETAFKYDYVYQTANY